MNKKAQMEFAWIFAVIVGAIILFLAFYFVGTRLLGQQYEQTTIQAQSLDILLNPFSQFGEIKVMSQNIVTLAQLANLTIDCNHDGLGDNTLTLTQKNTAGIPKTARDKYIFAEQNLETKKFQALSMPFEMPWRVADIVILWPYDKKYCFVKAPVFINESLGNETITGLNISSIIFVTSKNNCPENSIKVCFPDSSCDISVTISDSSNLGHKGSTAKKGQGAIYFAGDAMLYASIFSGKELYNCNFQRLAARLESQTAIYKEKAIALSQKGCSATFNLDPLKNNAKSLSDAQTIGENLITNLWAAAKQVSQQNDIADCSLY